MNGTGESGFDMLIDSWVWVELFEGSQKGAKARELMRGEKLYASALTLAEIAFWCMRSDRNPKQYLDAIKSNAVILSVDEITAETAGRVLANLRKKAPGMGMVDAILYVQAIASGVPLLTGDEHFKNLDGVQFIK